MDKIIIKNLNFFYRDFHALKDINLTIKARNLCAFIGHSGSGKSTLLRTLNRIYSLYPDFKATGEILLDGDNILGSQQNLTLLRKKVGMVFQTPTPFPTTIKENVSYGVTLYEKLTSNSLMERVEWALRKAALWDEVKDKLKKNSSELSQGQQQRLCVARAIAVKPDVILFDEPTASLDPKSSSIIQDLLLELKQEYTIVLVTHNLKQAKEVADFTAYIHEGKLIEFNETSKLLANPIHELTQRYLHHS